MLRPWWRGYRPTAMEAQQGLYLVVSSADLLSEPIISEFTIDLLAEDMDTHHVIVLIT